MGERDQPIEEVEGLLRETERQRETVTADPTKDHYPMCIVWSPIPVLSYVTPIIGHTGIALSDGTIKDFGGSYYIHVSTSIFSPSHPFTYTISLFFLTQFNSYRQTSTSLTLT